MFLIVGAVIIHGAHLSLRWLSHSGLFKLYLSFLSLSLGSSVGSGTIIASGSNVES
jgi:hypothetical protein